MKNLSSIITYIIRNYPHKDELSNARLTKLVYLADWHSSIHYRKQISSINWYFDNYGPFVWDIYKEAKNNANFTILKTSNYYGSEKKIITVNDSETVNLGEKELNSIDKVIEITKSLNWDDFISLVYSTYPILTSEKYSHLDLIKKAEERAIQTKNSI